MMILMLVLVLVLRGLQCRVHPSAAPMRRCQVALGNQLFVSRDDHSASHPESASEIASRRHSLAGPQHCRIDGFPERTGELHRKGRLSGAVQKHGDDTRGSRRGLPIVASRFRH